MKKNLFKFIYVSLAAVAMIALSRNAKADWGQCVAACEAGYTAGEKGCEDGCVAQYEANHNFNESGCISDCTNEYYNIEQECEQGCQ
jgi:hypothetical protein